jgi:uncharacterized membrane protein YqhA
MGMESSGRKSQNILAGFISRSRWLQALLCAGLIVTQTEYVYHFMGEIKHLVPGVQEMSETGIMLLVLRLIGMSSIRLLKTFINVPRMRQETVKWQA